MADLNYETEYDNRARVPDYAEIFLRWAVEAENYRAERLKAGRAELGLSYGDTPRQTIDLLLPDAGDAAPLAMFVHGGWWRSLEASSFSQMARGLNARGDRRCGRGLRSVPQRDNRRHHRADPPGLRVPVAAPASAPDALRTFGRRPLGFGDGGDRLALALSEGAARSGAGRICDLRRVRPRPAGRHQRESGFAARCRGSAPAVDGVLAASRRAGPSMPSPADSNPESSSARADSSPILGGKAARRRGTKKFPAQIISPSSTRWPIRRAPWWPVSPHWRSRSEQ